MMSKTHLTIGTAASLAITCPTTSGSLLAAMIGGCAGGILCDIECKSTPEMRDALYGRIIAAVVIAVLLCADKLYNTGIWLCAASRDKYWLFIGAAVLLTTGIFGRFSGHRTFTHSLFYVLIITFGFYCIVPKLMIPVLAGGVSHLAVDTLNYKPVPWLYPIRKKGLCFNLCYADKLGNKVLMWAGFAVCIVLITWRVLTIAGVSLIYSAR